MKLTLSTFLFKQHFIVAILIGFAFLNSNTLRAETSAGNVVYVKSEVLNLRSAPSRNSDILGKLVAGEKLHIYNSENGWLNVQVNGLQGWVTDKYITEGEPAIILKPALLTQNIVASTSAKTVSVNEGIPATIIYTRGSRAFVNVSDSLMGWIDTNALEQGETVATPYWVNSQTLNVRSSPGTYTQVIGSLTYGDKIRAIKEQNRWIKIRFNHTEGWVFKSLLSPKPLRKSQSTASVTSSDRRRKRYVEAHPDLPDIIAQTILNGGYRIGMSREQVEASLGEPDEIHQMQDSTMVGMVRWLYYRGDTILSLNLQNGYLFTSTKDFQ